MKKGRKRKEDERRKKREEKREYRHTKYAQSMCNEAKVLFQRIKRLKVADDVFAEIKLYQREALV